MNRRLIVRPEAEADITNGAVWYENRESGLGAGAYLGSSFGNHASSKEF